MSIATLHARSSRAEEWRILGIRLVPLTVGHLRHLEAEECDPVRTVGELGTAIRICSMPASEWPAWSRGRWTPARLAMWGRLLGKWDFGEKLALWSDYVRWHTELPVIRMKGDGRESVLPSYRFTRVKLLRLGYGWRDIDDVPYLDALWDITTAAELDGIGEALAGTEDDMDREAASVDWDRVVADATRELEEKLRKQ